MIRTAFALCLMLCPVAAQAVDFTGPLIRSAIPDRSRYQPGGTVTIPVVLANKGGATFGGTLSCQMFGRGTKVGRPSAVPVEPLEPAATRTVTVRFGLPPGEDNRGYQVICAAEDESGVIDTAATAVDVSSDWAKYARECFVTEFAAGTDTAAQIRGLRAYHCSVLQFYDVTSRHEAPFSPAPSWLNLEGTTVDAATVRSTIARGRASGMASLVYTLWNGSYPSGVTDGNGIRLDWGQFATKCAPRCGQEHLSATPSNGEAGGTNLFPSAWQARYLVEMDPTNPAWKAFWLAHNKPLIDRLGFDGCQIDTLGDFDKTYRADGTKIDYATALSGFVNFAIRGGCRRGVINNVSNGGSADVALHSVEDFYYGERHPEFGDAPNYHNVHDSAGLLRSQTSKAINYAIYLDEDHAQSPSCSTKGGPNTCYFNEPGLFYLEAVMHASGVWHAGFIDGPPSAPDDPKFISNILVSNPAAQLEAHPGTKQAMLDYASFAVGNEKLLRDLAFDVDGVQPASLAPGGCPGSMKGEAGHVYLIPKARPGFQMLHLINFCSLASTATQDRHADQPPPKVQRGIRVKMYYANGATGSNTLWFASPDIDHGAPRTIPYAKSFDDKGTFITFTVPSLKYWDMVWLELDSLAGSDYATP